MGIDQVANDYVNVKVQVGKATKNVKIEKGCVFENNGGKYVVDKDGKLNVFDKNSGEWKSASAVKMTNYQLKAFEAVANNVSEGSGIILSKKDILAAQEKFKKGGFKDDMSEFLPSGYKIEKPKMSTQEKYVQAYVTNGTPTQSATLKFQITEISKLKEASAFHQSEHTTKAVPARKNLTAAREKELVEEFNKHSYSELLDFESIYSLEKPNPLVKYKGKIKTLDDINNFISDMYKTAYTTYSLPDLDDLQYKGEGNWGEDVDRILSFVVKHPEAISSKNINTIINHIDKDMDILARSSVDGKFVKEEQLTSSDLRKFYNQLTPAQKKKYDDASLSPQYTYAWLNQYRSNAVHNIVQFDPGKKLSAEQYTKLTKLVNDYAKSYKNNPNVGGGNCALELRETISKTIAKLSANGNITPAQKKQLEKLTPGYYE